MCGSVVDVVRGGLDRSSGTESDAPREPGRGFCNITGEVPGVDPYTCVYTDIEGEGGKVGQCSTGMRTPKVSSRLADENAAAMVKSLTKGASNATFNRCV